jgi:mannose/fructose/N-acetylgalactosamine-specific phosphotransferase system component IID
MAVLRGRTRALLRLISIQSTWSYERMQGVGLGYGAEPLLRGLFGRDGPRYREALGRATGFFNANPYLAAAAVGAEARAEADGTPGPQIERLRTALCGPLGSLGDRLFWTGLVPALASAAIAAVALGSGVWPVLAFVLVHNLIRGGLGIWLLELGWQHGIGIGAAISASLLPRASTAVGRAAAVLGAAALPIAGTWLLRGAGRGELVGVIALMVGLLLLRRLAGSRGSALTLTLAAAGCVIFWHWGTA